MKNKKRIIWFTGQPGHGKTSLANNLVNYFKKNNVPVIHIDGDDLRQITNNQDYSKEGRIKNIVLAQNIAKFLYNKDFFVVVSLVAPYLNLRETFKNDPTVSVIEIYVHKNTPTSKDVFSVDDYEPPETNFINLDTTETVSLDDLLGLVF